jgi:UDP-glucose 4-epimerase
VADDGRAALMRAVVTGGAGFIGSNLTDRLLREGHQVTVVDDLSTGHRRFLEDAEASAGFELVELDLSDPATPLPDVLAGADLVFHLAANADVRFGWEAPRRDLEQNVLVTHRVLEAMRVSGVPRLFFSSTGSVYGEAEQIPTPESVSFPIQTSLYGASKASAEAFIQAYTAGTELRAVIFRFVSLLGPRYTHGHVVDFVRQLVDHPDRLHILGDGRQRKSYLHVDDCVDALLTCVEADPAGEVFNLGVDDYCTVTESAGWICERMGLSPDLDYSGGDRGWIGDNPFIWLDTAKIRGLGWSPRTPIREAVESTVDYLLDTPWVLERGDDRR